MISSRAGVRGRRRRTVFGACLLLAALVMSVGSALIFGRVRASP
jgi:hypothetical protein